MKIIKHGKYYIRRIKCDCGCEFEYQKKDCHRNYIPKIGNDRGCPFVKTRAYWSPCYVLEQNKPDEYLISCPECRKNFFLDENCVEKKEYSYLW